MLARCARCQNTFTTDHFGVQTCPHCGSEILLSDPNAPPPAPPSGGPPPPGPPPPPQGGSPGAGPTWGAPPPPPPWGGPPPSWGAPPPPPPPWAPPPPYAAAPPPPEQPAPFARRDELGWLSAFGQTWKLACLEPQRFFRAVQIDQPRSAVLFGVIAITLSQWFQAAYAYLAGASMQGVLDQLLRNMPQGQASFDPGFLRSLFGIQAFAARVVLAPLFALIAVYLSAGVFHVLLLVLRGAPRGFDATLTVVGYASGVQLIGAVPVCGAIVAAVWFVVAAIIGIAEAQRCGPGKAAAAVLLPGALLCLFCCGSLAAFSAAISGALKQRQGVTL